MYEPPTFVFTQEVNALLQYSGFVHLPGVARQHSAKLFDEDIELVPSFLLRLVTGHAANCTFQEANLEKVHNNSFANLQWKRIKCKIILGLCNLHLMYCYHHILITLLFFLDETLPPKTDSYFHSFT